MGQLRKTGLAIPDYLEWGSHICPFYESKGDLLELIVSYFRAGLEGNEVCIWVISDSLSLEDAKAAIRAAVPNLDLYMAKGQMEIIPDEQFYLIDGVFDSEAILDCCFKKEKETLASGYAGLRTVGNSFDLQNDRWEDWIAYENRLQEELAGHKIIAMCPHSLRRCTASQFLEAVESHDCAIVRRQGRWDCIDSKNSKQLLDRLFTKKKALAASIKKASFCLEHAADCIFFINSNARITFANQKACEVLGHTKEKLEEMTVFDIDPNMTPEQWRFHWEKIRKDKSFVIESNHLTKSGKIIPVEISVNYMKFDGQEYNYAFARDISKRKQAEKMVQASDTLSRK